MTSITVSDFYDYETLTEKLERVVDAAPDLVSMASIGETPENRDVWCLTVANRESGLPADDRPALLVTANLHASELAGSWVALQFLGHLVDAYPDDEPVRRLLDERTVYVVPRIAADGAETALDRRGKVVRSRYVDRDPDDIYEPNTVVPRDLTGDGRILSMRWPTEDGDQVPLDGDDRTTVSRDFGGDDVGDGDENGGDGGEDDASEDGRNESDGKESGGDQRYRVVTEGVVCNHDGGRVRDPHYGFARSDFNRNFPSEGWRPFDWEGHGKYPLSEPETRAVAEFLYEHTNVTNVVDLHCGNPAIFYPRALAGSDPEHPADADLLASIGDRAEAATGFPYVWGYGEITGERDPSESLPGSFKDFAYERLGIPSVIVELGLFYNSLGFDTADLGSDDHERERTRRMLEYHDENPETRLFHDWEPYDHPQLGEVEIGGLDWTTHGNPPAEAMPDVADRVTDFLLELTPYRPDVQIPTFDAEHLEGDLYHVSASVVNRGRVSTSLTERGATTDTHVPDEPRVDLSGGNSLTVVSGRPRRKLDHLDARGDRATLEWVVRAPDAEPVELSVTSVRGVDASETVDLD